MRAAQGRGIPVVFVDPSAEDEPRAGMLNLAAQSGTAMPALVAELAALCAEPDLAPLRGRSAGDSDGTFHWGECRAEEGAEEEAGAEGVATLRGAGLYARAGSASLALESTRCAVRGEFRPHGACAPPASPEGRSVEVVTLENGEERRAVVFCSASFERDPAQRIADGDYFSRRKEVLAAPEATKLRFVSRRKEVSEGDEATALATIAEDAPEVD